MVSVSIERQHAITPREKMWLWLIILVGAALRLYRLEAQSLWQDEGLQYFVASAENIRAVIERTQWRTWHPPLSFLVNHFFLLAGNSDFFLRLPSALCGIGSLPLCYMLIKRLASARTAVFVVLVLALSPFHIWYSQEGRMYAQLLFLFLLSSTILLHALEHRQWQWWGLYALVVAAGMLTHVLMAFGVLAHVLWLLLYHRRQLLSLMASGAVAVLLFLPWVFLFPWASRFLSTTPSLPRIHIGSASSGFSWEVLPYTFFAYSTGFSLGPSVAELHENRSLGFILQFLPLLLTVGIIVGTLLVIGIWALYKQYGARCVVFCLLGLVLPLGGAVLFSLMPRGLFNVRYTILAFPSFCTFVGSALAVSFKKNRLVGMVAGLAVLGICVASLANHFTNPRYAKEDIKAAVAAWRSLAPHEYLLSAVPGGNKDAINKYLAESERGQHIALGEKSDLVSKTREFFATHDVSSAYILLARDWRQSREKILCSAFSIADEHAYPGVKLLKVLRQ
jgi:uncharacterized membrane protein